MNRCECALCGMFRSLQAAKRALEDVDIATNVWLDDTSERDMAYHYLIDELEVLARDPRAFLVRRKLRKIMKTGRVS